MADFIAEPALDERARAPLTVIAAPGSGQAEAETAARLIGLSVAAAMSWSEAAAAGAELRFPGPVLLDTEGVDDALLARALPGIVQAAAATDAAVVVTLELAQIDLVAATLFGPGVQLLCEASLADRVGALAALGATQAVADPAAAGGAARVAQLSEEIARIAEALAELARRDGAGGGTVGDRTSGYQPAPADAPLAPAVTAADLRAAIRSRRLRDEVFGPGWFEDPAWDMLLDLLAAELEGNQVSISSLCIAAAVAPTTALRQIGKMAGAGLLERRPDPGDRRRAFMQLTPVARDAMGRYLTQARRGGMPIA